MPNINTATEEPRLYTEDKMIKIAKRDNNKKRNFLIVNRFQAKHIACSPSSAFQMFDELADTLCGKFNPHHLLIIGFAETATAIGTRVAVKLGGTYMTTTREDIENVSYLFFTESHSHATEQRLVKNDIDNIIDGITDILFVEDEVSTGNTILKLTEVLKKSYPEKNIHFSVASLINGMASEYAETYQAKNIDLYYLVKTQNDENSKTAETFSCNGKYLQYSETMESFDDDFYDRRNLFEDMSADHSSVVYYYNVSGYMDSRRTVNPTKYQKACQQLADTIISQKSVNSKIKKKKSVLVIGTEEFMYPAIYTAYEIEKQGCRVKCQSTTRSPIMVSLDKNYPLHQRFELKSPYEEKRKTFIYDVKKYDKVIVITDAPESREEIFTLTDTLRHVGNTDIDVVRWC